MHTSGAARAVSALTALMIVSAHPTVVWVCGRGLVWVGAAYYTLLAVIELERAIDVSLVPARAVTLKRSWRAANRGDTMNAQRNPRRKAPIREPNRRKKKPIREPGRRPKPIREPR